MDTELNADAAQALSDTLVRLTRADVFYSTLAFYLNPRLTYASGLL
jgi:hypothetical protein